MELKLTSYNIADLGSMLSDKLYELGITDSTLVIKLPSKEFKKVDEDLFYRNRKSDDEEYIPSNPLKNIKLMKNTTQVEGLTMDELKLLLDGFNQDTYAGYRGYLLTLLLADTGMRCGEAINLKWNQIDFKHDVVTLNASETKSGKMRFVPFSKKTNRVLREWKQEVAEVSEYYVFPSIYGDKPYRQREYRNLLSQISNELGMKHVHPHMIRHTFATQYLVHGGDALSLQKILGHSSLEMVRIYVDMSQKDITYKQNKFSPINFL